MHCGLDQDASGMRQQFPKIYFSKIWKSNFGVPTGLGFRKEPNVIIGSEGAGKTMGGGLHLKLTFSDQPAP